MCLAVRDSHGGFNPIESLFNLSLPKNSISYEALLFPQFCYDAYTPTLDKNIEDFLVSTYELCEDG
jgi:hypothetical protein